MLSWIKFWSSKPHLIHLSQTLSAQSSLVFRQVRCMISHSDSPEERLEVYLPWSNPTKCLLFCGFWLDCSSVTKHGPSMSCHHSILASQLRVLNPKSACSNYRQIENVRRSDFVTIHVAPTVSVLLWQARGCSHHKFDAKQPQKCKSMSSLAKKRRTEWKNNLSENWEKEELKKSIFLKKCFNT